MTFFPEPLNPSEGKQKQEDFPIIDPIESDKKYKEGSLDWRMSKSGTSFIQYGIILIYMYQFLCSFPCNEEDHLPQSKAVLKDDLACNIQIFLQLLQDIEEKDQSENPRFCQTVSMIWQQLSQDLHIHIRVKRKGGINIEKLQMVMTDIENYPPNDDHKLGFYLKQSAGEKWLPLPFRDILKQLHIDHHINHSHSVLSKWVELFIDALKS